MSGGTASSLWTDLRTWAPTITCTDPVQITPPDPEAIKRADAKEAREAVERQRKDEADRAERETAAKRAHDLAVMQATLDHHRAIRTACGYDGEAVGWIAAGAAALASLVTALAAAVIP